MTAPDRPGTPDGRSAPEIAGQAAYDAYLAHLQGADPGYGQWVKPFAAIDKHDQAAWEAAAQAGHRAIAAAAPAPQAAPGSLRADLEEALASWRENAKYRPADTRDEMSENYGVSQCADTLAGILADHPDTGDHLTPAASRGREGRLAAALAHLAADGQWLTVTEDGRLDIRDELLARKRYARDALAGNITPQPQAALDLARAETATVKAAAANTARELAEVTEERDKLRELIASREPLSVTPADDVKAAPELAAAMTEARALRALVAEILATFGTPAKPGTVRWTGKQVEQWRKRAGLQP